MFSLHFLPYKIAVFVFPPFPVALGKEAGGKGNKSGVIPTHNLLSVIAMSATKKQSYEIGFAIINIVLLPKRIASFPENGNSQ